ncbi:MAG: sulfurtransferase-like selenium metabolism protein YedF [Thermincola sp.]|jgi:selenium metabolism protein YedF|nr:sulfurtransferase-like selenium metabolism protein YedF [Thermincola sp.]MDT3703968.1 sulfurtransferase-like selenium metabolism protein YedF [Thermincola sp.]
MDSQILDARGLACPVPVVNTKKLLDSMGRGSVTTIVDNDAAKENLLTLAKGMGCEVEVQEKGNEYYIQITKRETTMQTQEHGIGNTVIYISADKMGQGSSELGELLMKSFFYALVESESIPQTLLFLNSGVNLTCENSPILEYLVNIEKRGVEVLSCGTCLDYYKIKEKLCVGRITNMYTILEKMTQADKVISL